MTRWCAHPRLAPDEPLSSWLHRYAWANSLSNHTFATRVFGPHVVWPRDLDRSISATLLRLASEVLEQPIERLERATLRRFEGTVFPVLRPNGWHPWLMPVGIYHRLHRHHGEMLCPFCLAEERPPRLSWRLAFSVACNRHRCRLLDACPTCDAPLAFHRLALHAGQRKCAHCGANLASRSEPKPLCQRAQNFQRRCYRASQGLDIALGAHFVTGKDFLEGTRYLLRGLYGNGRLNGLTQARMSMQRRAAFQGPVTGHRPPFEHWRLSLRMAVLSDLERYLEDWPETFIRDADRAHVYRCRFDSRCRLISPAWLAQAISSVESDRRVQAFLCKRDSLYN
mgnify:CR=1 FL=1